jgi:hypothetical protein
MDELYFGSLRKGNRGLGICHKIPIIAKLQRESIVKVEVLWDVSVESLLEMRTKSSEK